MNKDSYCRKIVACFYEDARVCAHCGKKLANKSGMLYIVAPSSNTSLEYCSWKCMYLSLRKKLDERIEAKKLYNSDLLNKMGYEREWDGKTPLKLTKTELESKIEDPR